MVPWTRAPTVETFNQRHCVTKLVICCFDFLCKILWPKLFQKIAKYCRKIARSQDHKIARYYRKILWPKPFQKIQSTMIKALTGPGACCVSHHLCAMKEDNFLWAVEVLLTTMELCAVQFCLQLWKFCLQLWSAKHINFRSYIAAGGKFCSILLLFLACGIFLFPWQYNHPNIISNRTQILESMDTDCSSNKSSQWDGCLFKF